MNVHLTARQMNLTPQIKAYCEKRLKSLEKLLGSVLKVDLILSVEKYRHKVEINAKGKGASLVIAEEEPDVMNALKLALDNLEKKVKKEKEKLREKKRRKSRERKIFPLALESPEVERKIIRSEDYSLKPMPLDEALLQLDLQKKEVFVFRQFGSEKLAVLYRRKDGNIGLIEPES